MKVYFSSRDKITKNEQLEQFFAGSIMEIPLEISWASGDVSSNTSLLLAVYGFITNAIFCIYRHRGALYLLPPGDTHLIPIQSTYSFYIHLKLWHHFGPFQEMVSYGKHYDPQHFWLLSLYQVCFQPVAHQPTQFQPVTHHQPTINALSSFHWSFGPVASQASEYYQVFSRTNHFFHLQLSLPPGARTHNRPHPTRCIGRQYARWSSEDKSERWRLTKKTKKIKKMIRHVCRCLLHRQIWGEGINFTF